VGVGAVVFRGDEVLLIKRARPPGKGLWSLPGGKVGPRERVRDACLRELFEETGVRARIGPLVGVFDRIGDGYDYVIVDFVAEAGPRAVPRAASDAAAARWFLPRDLARVRKTRGLIGVIRRARRLRARPSR